MENVPIFGNDESMLINRPAVRIGPKRAPRYRRMIERFHVHGDDLGGGRCNLADFTRLFGVHHDQNVIPFGATGMGDDDVGFCRLDGFAYGG